MSIPDLLNKKYLEWQYQKGERKTLDDFSAFIGVKRPLLSMWMNGTRTPGDEYKKRLIDLFGNDAIMAFGENPDIYAINIILKDADKDEIHSWREKIENRLVKNVQRTPKTRRTRTTE